MSRDVATMMETALLGLLGYERERLAAVTEERDFLLSVVGVCRHYEEGLGRGCQHCQHGPYIHNDLEKFLRLRQERRR